MEKNSHSLTGPLDSKISENFPPPERFSKKISIKRESSPPYKNISAGLEKLRETLLVKCIRSFNHFYVNQYFLFCYGTISFWIISLLF